MTTHVAHVEASPDEGLVVALGGTAWRNRPFAFLHRAAVDGTAVRTFIFRDGPDLQECLGAAWPDALVLSAGERPGADNPVALGMWASALGLSAVPLQDDRHAEHGSQPIVPDLAVLHVPFATAEGDTFWTPREDPWFERLIVASSRRVLVMADEILTTAQSQRSATAPLFRAGEVDGVEHVPYGAFPGSCDGLYRSDPEACGAFGAILSTARARDSSFIADLSALTTATQLAELSYPHGLRWRGLDRGPRSTAAQ